MAPDPLGQCFHELVELPEFVDEGVEVGWGHGEEGFIVSFMTKEVDDGGGGDEDFPFHHPPILVVGVGVGEGDAVVDREPSPSVLLLLLVPVLDMFGDRPILFVGRRWGVFFL